MLIKYQKLELTYQKRFGRGLREPGLSLKLDEISTKIDILSNLRPEPLGWPRRGGGVAITNVINFDIRDARDLRDYEAPEQYE